MVSRLVRVQETSGSNPDTSTKIPATTFVVAGIFIVLGFERPVRKHAGGMFLGRGRILWFPDAPLVGVDENQICPMLHPSPGVHVNESLHFDPN